MVYKYGDKPGGFVKNSGGVVVTRDRCFSVLPLAVRNSGVWQMSLIL